ncbi:MAG: hypothetical protein K0S61_4317 [Anaerocolumna sp.]|jgi:hypothetical protein|nr:hypothetical protein [Anaerocolumna sp.]
MIGLMQIILFIVACGQVGSLQTDYITISQFYTREVILLGCIGILQLIKEAVSTRNTHSR